jgi:hypothetical protein
MVLLAGAVQADVVGLNTFANEYVGAQTTATVSDSSGTGFKLTVNSKVSGDGLIATSAGLTAGSKAIAVGETAKLVFTVTPTALGTMDLGFRWGLDFGDTILLMRADTASSAGSYGSTFFRQSYVTANGSPTNTQGSANANWSVGDEPSVEYLVKGGNPAFTITNEIKRISANSYSIATIWGGKTYVSTNNFTASDHTIDSVFFGYGQLTGGGSAAGNNYTISNVSLNVIPEPATISMLGIGAVVVMLIRRTQSA